MAAKPPHPDTILVKAAEGTIFDRLTSKIGPLGFSRTLKRIWTRSREHYVEFIHLHRGGISYGGVPSLSISYRVHLGIRILNDPTPNLVLNGPDSDKGAVGLHLRCHARNEATYERCVTDLARYCVEIASPWFERCGKPMALFEHLLYSKSEEVRAAFQRAVEGNADEGAVRQSKKLLGLKLT